MYQGTKLKITHDGESCSKMEISFLFNYIIFVNQNFFLASFLIIGKTKVKMNSDYSKMYLKVADKQFAQIAPLRKCQKIKERVKNC